MPGAERHLVLGLAPPRASWPARAGAWATAGILPVELVQCLGVHQLGTWLESGRPVSMVWCDHGATDVDRALVAGVRRAGVAVALVGPADLAAGLGVDLCLGPDPTPAQLLDALDRFGRPGAGVELDHAAAALPDPLGDRGTVLAVIGGGGTGTSTVAAALSQAIALRPGSGGRCVLADLALDASQAMYHDVGDVLPALQEMAEAHRRREPGPRAVRAGTFAIEARRYDLLLGLRRPGDWTAVGAAAIRDVLRSLTHSYDTVVADLDPSLDDEAATGSADIEERHAAALVTLDRADVVLAVGSSDLRGTHRLLRLLEALDRRGVDPTRVVVVVNRAPRSPRWRSAHTALLAELRSDAAPPAATVFVPFRRGLDDVHRRVDPLPGALCAPLVGATDSVLRRAGHRHGAPATAF